MMSPAPPGGYGMISLTGCDGNASARAGRVSAATAAPAARSTRRRSTFVRSASMASGVRGFGGVAHARRGRGGARAGNAPEQRPRYEARAARIVEIEQSADHLAGAEQPRY